MKLFERAENKRATAETDDDVETAEIYYRVSQKLLKQIMSQLKIFTFFLDEALDSFES